MQKIMEMIMSKDAMNVVAKGENLFKNLPHLPVGVVEFFVKIAPYLALFSAVLGLIFGPIVGLVGLLSVITLNPFIMLSILGGAVLMFVNVAMMLYAYKPLQNREYKGWLLLFWSEVLTAVTTVLSVLGNGSIASVIWLIIGFYVLYEIKPAYNGKKPAKA